MSNLFKKFIAFTLLFAVAFSTISCHSKKKKREEEDAANANKMVLNVYSFTSGYKTEWLTEAIKDYEKANKNTQYGDKTGIIVKPTMVKSDVPGPTMAGRQEVVYFLEQQDYYELISNNYVSDIAPAITKPNPYDGGKTLESKMFEDQKSYFGRVNNGQTSYYAFPHYFTSFGIVYDVDLFDSKGYYFVEGYDRGGRLQDMFLGVEGVEQGWPKTAGPDTIPGNSDDGLPTTYEEFFLLCRFIGEVGNDNPLLWSGQYRDGYVTHFLNALVADYEGYDQMRLNFTFNGYANNLGSIVGNEFVKDATPTKIDYSNGYELARQAGKYYAMDFYNDLYNMPVVNNKENESKNYSSTYSHEAAQEDFLIPSTKRNAMLLDGSWWETESTPVFDDLVESKGQAYSKQNRRIGWMPLPKQNADLVDGSSTAYDIMYPLCVVKGGLDTNSWEYKCAIDFIQFINSDAQLAKFTKITGCTKALNYTLTPEQYNSLTYFGKSYYDMYKKSDIIFPYDNNIVFANNQLKFSEMDKMGVGSPLYKSTAHSTYFVRALEEGVTLKDYFNGMYVYFQNLGCWKS